MQLNPADLESLANLATAYLETGRLDDAERAFERILATNPDSAKAQNGPGLIAVQRRDPESAYRHFKRAVQLDPNLLEAQANLGLIYEMAGQRELARRCFETFLAKAYPSQYATMIPKVCHELATLRQKKP